MIKYKKICCMIFMMLGVLWAGITVYAVEPEELLQHLEAAAQGGPVYEVKPDGTGDFSSIQEAVEQVESGATLLIYQGVYEENVEILDKTVNLIGADRDACILITDTTNYHHVPLTIGAGVVYNMTICGSNPARANMIPVTDTEYDESDLASIYNLQNRFPGYALHIDQDYSCGRELRVEGCRIISDSNYCVGIGCRGGNSIILEDCQIYSNGGGCVYLHNVQNDSGDGEAYFTIRDCELKNYSNPYVMSIHSTGDLNPVYLTFQNVKVSTVAYESKSSYVIDNMNIWYTIDQLADPMVQKRLETEGYCSSLGRELIHYCDKGTKMRLSVKRDRESLLGEWPELAEGIHYISRLDKPDSRVIQGANLRKRQVIEIKNWDLGASKEGWCGLHNIYLTDESYGNTLIEMNAARVGIDAGVE